MTSNESAPSSIEDSAGTSSDAPRYWRSLSQLRGNEDFNQYVEREFPVAASEFPEGVSRRRWMKLMGASLAFAGVSGCRYPVETIEPFVVRPEGRVPGETYSRATNFELAGRVYNLLVSCVDGRPLKIEPNEKHPAGVGTDVYSQASILGLYDPDRSRGDDGFLIYKGAKRRVQAGWDRFDDFGKTLVANAVADKGAKFAVLMSPTASPSILRMLGKLKERLPQATICQFDGVTGDAMGQATASALGKPAKQVLALDDAKVIVALQADILGNDKGMLGNAASFAKHRDPGHGDMNRLYVIEGGFTSTGAAADARLALQPSQMPAFLAELGRRVDALAGGETHDHSDTERPFDDREMTHQDRLERYLDVLAHDLYEKGDKAVVVVGDHLGAAAIEAGIRMNAKLGSLGKLQKFVPVGGDLGETISLAGLVSKINNGGIDSLLVLGDNPVVTAPGDVDLAAAIGQVENSVYLGEYDDETGFVCGWSLPLAHPLESWGDCIGDQGHYGVCQPHISPLLGGRSVIEVLAVMLGEDETEGSRIVRRTADAVAGKSLLDRAWRKLLHEGFDNGIMEKSAALAVQGDGPTPTASGPTADGNVNKDAIEVLFVPADGLYDGRFANNGWLQEMPQSLTKLAWDNAAVMSPATAKALDVGHGMVVALRKGDATVELPVYEMPGCAPGVVTVAIGYGRQRAGEVGGHSEIDGADIIGTDVSPIRSSDEMLIAYNVEARPRYREYELATTQDHWAIDAGGMKETKDRSFSLIREGTIGLYEENEEFVEAKGPHVPHVGEHGSMWEEPIHKIREENKREGKDVPQWGMAIDLTKCTGCNACVVACQSENNVPIVGREQVLNNREMHWLRVDRYFQGDEEHADVVQQPMACQHCETAPCEQVCPVAATVHTNEGINAMAYNRCIGTRYCANNCPFKVRRFNYFNYNQDVGVGYGVDAYESNIESASRKLQSLVLNPEVTVRGRGVMEKCTYCIQRVEKAKITARKEDRQYADGDVVTACQSACPTKAIDFGSVADPKSKVSEKQADPRSYGMLGQLNIKPRTEYLARVRNVPERLMTTRQLKDLEEYASHHGGGHGHDDHDGHAHDDDHAHDEDHGHEEDHSKEEEPTAESAAE